MRRENATLASVAPLTVLLLVANIILFFVSAARSQGLMRMDTDVLNSLGASTREGMWEGEWLRLVAPMFLHGGLIHIAMNMNFLWRAGPDTEIYFGTPNFGTIYLLSGATGICFSQIFSGVISIGASTSLCGIMGAHLAVLVINAPVPSRAWRNSNVRAVAMNLLILFGIGILGFFNMDNWGHFGGIVGGVIVGGSLEMLRRRKPLGIISVVLSLVFVGALICAARWTVFNPTYHVYQAALASEAKDTALAAQHKAEAVVWGKRFSVLHFLGVLNDEESLNVLKAHDKTLWKIKHAHRYRMNFINKSYRSGTEYRRMPEPEEEAQPQDNGNDFGI